MLAVYSLEQAEEWDAVVRSFREYDVYWLSGYVKAFRIHGDGEPLLFYYEDAAVRGINAVMKRDIADDKNFKGKLEKGRYSDFATPYGYGGWIIEGQESGPLFESYLSWIEKNGIISEFVRFHPLIKNQENNSGFYETVRLGEVVHMDLSSPETVWNNMTGKNRGHIRKAIKSGVLVYSGRYPEIFEKFRLIYEETMKRDNADAYYYFERDFYKSVLHDLSENAQIFYAESDGKVIAATIILAANGRITYHLSGNLQEYGSLCATNLLLHKAALWGCENGYRTLHLGGGVGSGEDSLFKFKRSFYKGELNHFYIGKKIYDEDRYNELADYREGVQSSYFPLYRAAIN